MASGCFADGISGFALDGYLTGDHHTWQFLALYRFIERIFLRELRIIVLRRSRILANFTAGIFSSWNCAVPEKLF